MGFSHHQGYFAPKGYVIFHTKGYITSDAKTQKIMSDVIFHTNRLYHTYYAISHFKTQKDSNNNRCSSFKRYVILTALKLKRGIISSGFTLHKAILSDTAIFYFMQSYI